MNEENVQTDALPYEGGRVWLKCTTEPRRTRRGIPEVFMLSVSLVVSMAALSTFFSACKQSAEAPVLCVFSAKELAGEEPESFPCPDPAKVAADSEAPARCGAVAAGEVYFIRHELPDNVLPEEPLELRIQTPCGESKLLRRHVNGVVLVSQEAPPRAECFLSVTAVIANSELRCTATSPVDACSDVDAGCVPPDAATDGGP